MTRLEIFPIPALQDNYIWVLRMTDASDCVVIDPGAAQPVIDTLSQKGLSLSAILVTHHHWDHTQGIQDLLSQKSVPVFGPKQEQSQITTLSHPLQAGNCVEILQASLQLSVLSIPGHTLGHVAYYAEPVDSAPILFCGDTLFGGGCGRIFEGTADELYDSLLRLSRLPDNTQLYCGHEYTINNLHFAHELEPDYLPVQKRLQSAQAMRAQQKVTLPSTLAEEKRTNPFFRCESPSLIQSILKRFPSQNKAPIEIFKQIRHLKDTWYLRDTGFTQNED